MTPAAVWPALRRLRERAGLSVRELAARAGMDPTHLSRTELGQRPATSLAVVLRILHAMQSTLCALQREAKRDQGERHGRS